MKYPPKKCTYCEQEFIPERRNRKYCSDTCKQYNYLTKKTGKKYGIVAEQFSGQSDAEASPLIVEEQLPTSAPTLLNTKPVIITYEFMGADKLMRPPDPFELRKWYSTCTG